MQSSTANEVIDQILIISVVIFVLVAFIALLLILYSWRRKKMNKAFQKELLQSQLEIQEQTLQHVSNELHDNIAQVAGIIKMNLYTIKLNDIDKAAHKLVDIKELTSQLITDIRMLSQNMNGERVTQIGLCKALEMEIERINKTDLFTASFEQHGDLIPLNDDKIIILYRMVQETLNNMVKHSNAKEIKLKLSSKEDLLRLVLSDDGEGFDVEEKLKNGTGAGLHNLQKRAKLINATLTINSQIGTGTSVVIEYPYFK